MRKRITWNRLMAFVAVLILGVAFGLTQLRADAGPAQKTEAYRAAFITSDGHIQKAVLLKQAVYTMPNTTPVNGSVTCIEGDASKFSAEFTLTGTMAGTAPVVTVVLQHSIDYDPSHPTLATWRQVGTSFAAVNATVTPAGGREDVAFSDVAASTAVVWGDCYRVRYTWAGSGTVTANIGVAMIAK